MNTFTITLRSGKSFKGNIVSAKTIVLPKEEVVSTKSTVTRYVGNWEYENMSGFLSIDSELDPESLNLNSLDVLIDSDDKLNTDKLEEAVCTQLIINDYIVKNFNN